MSIPVVVVLTSRIIRSLKRYLLTHEWTEAAALRGAGSMQGLRAGAHGQLSFIRTRGTLAYLASFPLRFWHLKICSAFYA